MGKRWVVRGVSGLAVGLACLLFWLALPHESLQEKFDKLQLGMTEARVRAILGCPPGNYQSYGPMGYVIAQNATAGQRQWQFDEGYVQVWFDAEKDSVGHKRLTLIKRDEPFLDRVRLYLEGLYYRTKMRLSTSSKPAPLTRAPGQNQAEVHRAGDTAGCSRRNATCVADRLHLGVPGQ
jgi:hypothetical protein